MIFKDIILNENRWLNKTDHDNNIIIIKFASTRCVLQGNLFINTKHLMTTILLTSLRHVPDMRLDNVSLAPNIEYFV